MKTLGDVCAFDKVQGIHRGLPYVGLEHIESHTARFIGSTDPQPVKSSTFRFSDEHVLYGRLRPYLNKALAPDFEGHCSTEIFPLRPSRDISREYLLYWLLAAETCERINATCTGARMPRAQMNEVMGFDFPSPPLAEQQRIVGILDEAFNGIATAKANAEKNLQNACALFESHLQSVFTQRGEGWHTKILGNVCQIKPPKSEARNKVATDELVSFLPMEALGIDKMFVRADQEKPLSEVTGSYTYFADGDLLLAKITPCFENGKLGIAEGLTNGIGFGSSEYIVFRPDEILSKEWLYHYLSREAFRVEGAARMTGAVGHKRVAKEFIEHYPIPIPPLSEQQRIVGMLNSLNEESQRLARLYQRKLATLDALKKSLLHQAFTGEL